MVKLHLNNKNTSQFFVCVFSFEFQFKLYANQKRNEWSCKKSEMPHLLFSNMVLVETSVMC